MSGRQEVAGGEEGGVGEAGAGDKVRGARCGVDVGGGRCVLIMAVSRPRWEVWVWSRSWGWGCEVGGGQ